MLGGLDQALGFLFGVARGVLLVAVAFIVYDRAVAADTIPMVDNSRSAKVFASFQGSIDETIPDDAPGWIVGALQRADGQLRRPGRARPTRPTPPRQPACARELTGLTLRRCGTRDARISGRDSSRPQTATK